MKTRRGGENSQRGAKMMDSLLCFGNSGHYSSFSPLTPLRFVLVYYFTFLIPDPYYLLYYILFLTLFFISISLVSPVRLVRLSVWDIPALHFVGRKLCADST